MDGWSTCDKTNDWWIHSKSCLIWSTFRLLYIFHFPPVHLLLIPAKFSIIFSQEGFHRGSDLVAFFLAWNWRRKSLSGKCSFLHFLVWVLFVYAEYGFWESFLGFYAFFGLLSLNFYWTRAVILDGFRWAQILVTWEPGQYKVCHSLLKKKKIYLYIWDFDFFKRSISLLRGFVNNLDVFLLNYVRFLEASTLFVSTLIQNYS